MTISRRDFIKKVSGGFFTSIALLNLLESNLGAQNRPQQRILWIASDSSLLQMQTIHSNHFKHFLEQNYFNIYQNELVDQSEIALEKRYDIVIVEGYFAQNQKLIERMKQARVVILLGNEACFNVNNAIDEYDRILDEIKLNSTSIIKLSGMPVNIKYLLASLNHIYLFGIPELDSLKRPLMIYKNPICDQCEFRGDLEKQNFVKFLGEKKGCLYLLGCKGPFTYNNCAKERWGDTNQWCVSAGSPCIGCSNEDFPTYPHALSMYSNDIHEGGDKWLLNSAKGAFALTVGGIAVHALSKTKNE